MNIFFTSDEHYGHSNIIKYCNRPFESVEEMDEVIINNHNKAVKHNDITYHLGDFTLKNNYDYVNEKYVSRLNGKHVFVKGSHDYWLRSENITYIIEKKIKGMYVVMCHYAMRTWPRSQHGSLQLHGHSHSTLDPFKNQYDVGVDNCNFSPISFDELKEKYV